MKISKLLLVFSLAVLLGCEKEKDCPAPEPPPQPLSKTEMLIKYTWQVDELMHMVSCQNTSYVRGGSNTTGTNYNVMRFTFNANGTGTHTSETGQTYTTAWQFASANERKIALTVNTSTPISFQWNMVEITDSAVHATVAINGPILESFRLTPVGN